MNTAALKDAALDLPRHERAQLVHLLLDSLDEPTESSIEQAWLQAAAQRADEVDQNKVQLLSSEVFEQQVQALFK